MTKPTYSELEAENLRVRGLLQRYGDHTINCAGWDAQKCDCGFNEAEAEANSLQSSSLVSEGAESADIGKLDAADKKGDMSLEEIVSRWKAEEKLWKEREAELLAKFPVCSSCGERVITSWEAHEDDCAGSAETGGEKA